MLKARFLKKHSRAHFGKNKRLRVENKLPFLSSPQSLVLVAGSVATYVSVYIDTKLVVLNIHARMSNSNYFESWFSSEFMKTG